MEVETERKLNKEQGGIEIVLAKEAGKVKHP